MLHAQNERTTLAIPPLELNPAAQNISNMQICAWSFSLWFISAAGSPNPRGGEGKYWCSQLIFVLAGVVQLVFTLVSPLAVLLINEIWSYVPKISLMRQETAMDTRALSSMGLWTPMDMFGPSLMGPWTPRCCHRWGPWTSMEMFGLPLMGPWTPRHCHQWGCGRLWTCLGYH